MKVLVLHGPNLNLLGSRNPALYGSETLEEINARLQEVARARGVALETRQTNLEGELVTWLQSGEHDAVVINPGGYAHSSVAIRDAMEICRQRGTPVVEVHLSNVHDREAFRQRLITAGRASGVIAGFGPLSYELGLEAAIRLAATPGPQTARREGA
ncbi:MAG: 3-dehydroquinate dehydratase [Deltaproteobacteria bacterium]|nr:MAG: 3-dehydroquinate dehydratase [Deltaproteobacteria bacterium]